MPPSFHGRWGAPLSEGHRWEQKQSSNQIMMPPPPHYQGHRREENKRVNQIMMPPPAFQYRRREEIRRVNEIMMPPPQGHHREHMMPPPSPPPPSQYRRRHQNQSANEIIMPPPPPCQGHHPKRVLPTWMTQKQRAKVVETRENTRNNKNNGTKEMKRNIIPSPPLTNRVYSGRYRLAGQKRNRRHEAIALGRHIMNCSSSSRAGNHSNKKYKLDTNARAAPNASLSNRNGKSTATTASNETHIIFAIDSSRSMEKMDVIKKKGKESRWNAVFECMNEFIIQQLEHHGKKNENKDAVESMPPSQGRAIVSVLIFDDEANTLLERMPLVGDGKVVLNALETTRKTYRPKGGTGFSAAFERAKLISSKSQSQQIMTNKQNVVLVFLSDGRPGDLNPRPPKSPNLPMQDTFRRNGKQYHSAGKYIEEMKEMHGDNLSMHFICIYSEGKEVCFENFVEEIRLIDLSSLILK